MKWSKDMWLHGVLTELVNDKCPVESVILTMFWSSFVDSNPMFYASVGWEVTEHAMMDMMGANGQ